MNQQNSPQEADNEALKAIAPAVVLTIAGFDPSCGAGVTADLKVFAAHGIFGMAAITALTVQSTQGVRRILPVEAKIISETLRCLGEDVRFAGIKVGMLGTGEAVDAVTGFLHSPAGEGAATERSRVVLDPILRSSSGYELLERSGVERLKRDLLRHVGWITPNLDEIGVLTGLRPENKDEVARAAGLLHELAVGVGNTELNIVVTGGHLDQPDDYLLTAAGEAFWLGGEHIATNSTHGTGCAFSTALLCGLISGDGALEAVSNAKKYVASALKSSYPVGQGHGPINHLFRFQ